MLEYKLEDGRYVCYGRNGVLLSTDQVMLLVDQDGDILLKHGDHAAVKRSYDAMRDGFAANPEFADMAGNLVMVEGPRDIGELNHLLQCTGYTAVYMKKLADTAARMATGVLQAFTLSATLPVGPAAN